MYAPLLCLPQSPPSAEQDRPPPSPLPAVAPISEILKRVPSKQLMQLYKIAVFAGADQFLQHVAHVRGKLRKGGTPDMVSAAKVVLQVRGRWRCAVRRAHAMDISIICSPLNLALYGSCILSSVPPLHTSPHLYLASCTTGLE